MKNRRITKMSMSAWVLLILSFSYLSGGTAQTAEILVDSSVLDQAMDVLAETYGESAAAQEEINRLANEVSSTFEEFKRENDNLESLLVLNASYRQQIAQQEEQIATLNESIESVEQLTREVPMLMEKMLSALEQYVEMDYPFHAEERRNRLRFARDAIGNPDVSIAEKFRQVLVAYQTETAYGRTNETYSASIDIDGTERDVNIVRFGRIALLAQTTDRQQTRAWNNDTRTWEELPAGEYRAAVQAAIRVASQLDAPDILEIPIQAPEAAQ